MDRRQFLGYSSLALGTSLATRSAKSGPTRQDKPNIIYVFSDEHRYQSMAHTELPEVQTPHMARMAREGLPAGMGVPGHVVCRWKNMVLLPRVVIAMMLLVGCGQTYATRRTFIAST